MSWPKLIDVVQHSPQSWKNLQKLTTFSELLSEGFLDGCLKPIDIWKLCVYKILSAFLCQSPLTSHSIPNCDKLLWFLRQTNISLNLCLSILQALRPWTCYVMLLSFTFFTCKTVLTEGQVRVRWREWGVVVRSPGAGAGRPNCHVISVQFV